MAEKESTLEVLRSVSKVTAYLIENLGDDYEEEITQEHFVKSIREARGIDPRSTFLWVRKNRDRFTPEMITYAQGLYEKELGAGRRDGDPIDR